MSSLNLVTFVRLHRTLIPDQYQSGNARFGEQFSHYIEITAQTSASQNLNLFVFQIEPYVNEDNTTDRYAVFSNVASTYDLQDIPEGIPSASWNGTFFRYHKVEAYTRSLTEAEYIWDEIQKDVASLVAHHKRLIAATGTDETVIVN